MKKIAILLTLSMMLAGCTELAEDATEPSVLTNQDLDGVYHSILVKAHQVELQPPLYKFQPPRSIHLSMTDKMQIFTRWPNLDALADSGLEARLTGEHIMLASWMLERDLEWCTAGAKLINPPVISCFAMALRDAAVAGTEEVQKANAIITR